MSVKQLKRVTLTMGRSPGFPDGSSRHGYNIVAPLDDEGRLDADLWRTNRSACVVRRFRHGEDDRFGLLRRRPGGAWFIDYDETTRDDDETGYRLDRHVFLPGEYVSFTDEDGESRPYVVSDVHAFG